MQEEQQEKSMDLQNLTALILPEKPVSEKM